MAALRIRIGLVGLCCTLHGACARVAQAIWLTDGATADSGIDRGPADALDADRRCPRDAGSIFCLGNELLRCVGNTAETQETCPLGCDVGLARCRGFVASNVDDRVSFDEGTADLVVGDLPGFPYWAFNTQTGAISAYSDSRLSGSVSADTRRDIRPGLTGRQAGVAFSVLSQQPTGPASPAPMAQLGVFSVRSLEVKQGYTLVPRGAHAFVLLAGDSIRVEGSLDAGANFIALVPGPGGYASGAGPGRGGDAVDSTSGGGGAGYGAEGTPGGPDGAGAGIGGTAYGDASLIPLWGGSGGGMGNNNGALGLGGPGGGALQLSARREIAIAGAVNVGGGGAFDSGTNALGAGGGGSGGSLLLEAPTITIAGFVGANGGAGGPSAALGTALSPRGTADVAPAVALRPGGNGSDAQGVPGPASQRGGGGGGPGRVRINTALGAEDYSGHVLPTIAPFFTQGPLLAE